MNKKIILLLSIISITFFSQYIVAYAVIPSMPPHSVNLFDKNYMLVYENSTYSSAVGHGANISGGNDGIGMYAAQNYFRNKGLNNTGIIYQNAIPLFNAEKAVLKGGEETDVRELEYVYSALIKIDKTAETIDANDGVDLLVKFENRKSASSENGARGERRLSVRLVYGEGGNSSIALSKLETSDSGQVAETVLAQKYFSQIEAVSQNTLSLNTDYLIECYVKKDAVTIHLNGETVLENITVPKYCKVLYKEEGYAKPALGFRFNHMGGYFYNITVYTLSDVQDVVYAQEILYDAEITVNGNNDNINFLIDGNEMPFAQNGGIFTIQGIIGNKDLYIVKDAYQTEILSLNYFEHIYSIELTYLPLYNGTVTVLNPPQGIAFKIGDKNIQPDGADGGTYYFNNLRGVNYIEIICEGYAYKRAVLTESNNSVSLSLTGLCHTKTVIVKDSSGNIVTDADVAAQGYSGEKTSDGAYIFHNIMGEIRVFATKKNYQLIERLISFNDDDIIYITLTKIPQQNENGGCGGSFAVAPCLFAAVAISINIRRKMIQIC